MTSDVKKEYDRLLSLFKDVDETKTKLVDELLRKAAFLKVELDGLEKEIRKIGVVQKSSKGNYRQSVPYKTFLQSLGTYQAIIKTLNSVLGRDVIDEDDEFDEFMKNI